MELTFKRRLTNELMTTYVPSFFLLAISYATIHFKTFYFEANVTVNLTVMLVATTLFIRFSVMKATLESLVSICLKAKPPKSLKASIPPYHNLHSGIWGCMTLLPAKNPTCLILEN